MVPIAVLRRRAGNRQVIRCAGSLAGLSVIDAQVPETALVSVDLIAESFSDDVRVSGRIDAPYVAVCRRCLKQIDAILTLEVREIFEPRPTDGETYALGSDTMDLEPMIREAVLLGLPLAPLCAADCGGPAPDRYIAQPAESVSVEAGVAEAGVAPESTAIDPRWAALRSIKLAPE